MDHPVLFCHSRGSKALLVVRVRLDFFIDYVDIDMVVDMDLLMDATVLDTSCENLSHVIQS